MDNFKSLTIKHPSITRAILIIFIYVLFFHFLLSKSICKFIIDLMEDYSGRISSEWPDRAKIFISSLINIIVYISIALPFAYLLYDELKMDYYLAKHDQKSFMKMFYTFIAIFYAASYVASLVSHLLYNQETKNQSMIDKMISKNNYLVLPLIITVCVIGPIVEEIVYRKAIFSFFKNKYVAIAVSSIIFGIIHVTSTNDTFIHLVILSIPYVTSGFMYSLAYEKSNHNIWLPIMIHIVNNSLSIIFILLF